MVDPVLVQQLFDRQRAIEGLITSLARDPELAEEFFDEMASQLCQGKLSIAGLSPEATTCYLLKSAANKVYQHFRKRSRQPRTLEPAVIEAVFRKVEEALEDGELWLQALRLCLQNLTPRQVRNLMEFYGNGRTVKDLQADGDPRREGTIYKENNELKHKLRECVNNRVEQGLR